MKILFLARRFWPDIGGVEKHVFEISRILIKKGHGVTIITQSKGEGKKLEGIEVVRIPGTSKYTSEKIHVWKWIWKNKELIKKADIVHAHDVYWWYLPIKLLFLGKKSFITFHGYETYPISISAIAIRKFSEWLASGNIIVGDFIKKRYFTIPNFVIYGGVNIPKSIKNPIKKESAIFFGRLDEHTGILDYAKAVDIIRKKYPDFDFKIVGDGELKNKLSKYNPVGFSKTPSKHLSGANFAFVSRYLSILEALVHKKLVFALYDNPVKEDYLKMAPFAKFIIIENSPEKLAEEVIFYLINAKKADELVNKGYDWAKKQTWEKVVNTYLKLWKIN